MEVLWHNKFQRRANALTSLWIFIVINNNNYNNRTRRIDCRLPSWAAEYSPRPWELISFRTPTRLNRSYRIHGLWLWWERTRWKLSRPNARWTSCLWTPRPTVACPVGSSGSCTVKISCSPARHVTTIL